jgi:hypothetical protein
MDTRFFVGIVAGVLLLGLYYVEGVEQSEKLPAEYTQGPEALDWLRKNDSESALASNRFGDTSNAIQFVKSLYGAGAARIIVPQTTIQSDEIETYADSIVVSLPSDPAKRDRVWQLCAEELRREGDAPDKAPADEHVLLWWD